MKFMSHILAIFMSAMLCISIAFAEVNVKHKPIKKAKSGQRIELNAKINDDEEIREVRAYWKTVDDTRFWFVPMLGSGKNYKGILPAFALGAKSVDYRLYVVNEAGEFVKTQLYTITITDDEEALARLEAKEPTNIEIDTTTFEEVRDLARSGGEPTPEQRVDVRNDVPGSTSPTNIPGVQDYIVVSSATPAAAGAGLASATTISASAGAGFGAVAAGVGLAAAGAAAAGGGSSSSGDDGGGAVAPSPSADGTVSSRNVSISVIDFNDAQDDFFDLYVNGSFIGAVNNPPGGTTSHNATLRSGANTIELLLTRDNDNGTRLRIDINNGEFSRDFSGTRNHTWVVNAP